ncbi:MAG TPA: hypothetical protein VHF58_08245 [Solirubrobacterales bacterium]|nr:hypothetical protein [Solirubrobacterales bacterium]
MGANDATRRFVQKNPLPSLAIGLAIAVLGGGGVGAALDNEPDLEKRISTLTKKVKTLQRDVRDVEKDTKDVKKATRELTADVKRLRRRR